VRKFEREHDPNRLIRHLMKLHCGRTCELKSHRNYDVIGKCNLKP
jgi:hypothetical protein